MPRCLLISLLLCCVFPRGLPVEPASCVEPASTNEACWEDPAQEALCCGRLRPLAQGHCWIGPYTARRCCDVARARQACASEDHALLESIMLFFETGVVPAAFAKDEDALELQRWLRGGGLDDELDRCASVALASLAVRAELLLAQATPLSLAIAEDVFQARQVLESAAHARGTMRVSMHTFPEVVVYEAFSRLVLAMQMHKSPDEFFQIPLDHLGYAAVDDGDGCLVEVAGTDECTRRGFMKEGSRKVVVRLASLLLVPVQAEALRRQAADASLASQTVALARLLGAADLRGIRDGHARRLLADACRELVVAIPEDSHNFRRLWNSAKAVAAAMDDGTRGSYAEQTKGPINKDDFVLELAEALGNQSGSFAEIGVGFGARECNTRILRQHRGWHGIMLDQSNSNEEIGLYRRLVSAETITDIFGNLNVAKDLDLLSIDVDGNDFWFWRALLMHGYRPRAVIIEFLLAFGGEDIVSRYSPDSAATFARHDSRNVAVTGASLAALVALGSSFGYRLVKQIQDDAVFVRDGDVTSLPTLALEELGLEALSGEVVQALFSRYDTLYTTSRHVLKNPESLAADFSWTLSWTASCLEQVLGELCDDDITGSFCYKSWV